MHTRAVARRRSLLVLACCTAAGLGASGCDEEDAACTSAHDELTAFIEVRDDNGPCTECSLEGGLMIIAGLANGCEQTARFTTASSCLMQSFMLVTESGEMIPTPIVCLPVFIDWELQPGEVVSSSTEWGRGDDWLSSSWGPVEPGRYRLILTMTNDLMTDSEVAPAVEAEIVVTAQ